MAANLVVNLFNYFIIHPLLTLQYYFVPESYFIKLINEQGKLTAIRCPGDSEPIADVSP